MPLVRSPISLPQHRACLHQSQEKKKIWVKKLATILPTSVLPVVEPFPAVSRPPPGFPVLQVREDGAGQGPWRQEVFGVRPDGGEVAGRGEGSQDVPQVCAHAYRVRRDRPPRPHWAGSAAGSYSPGRPGSPALWAPSPGEAVELDSLVGWGIAASWPAAVA